MNVTIRMKECMWSGCNRWAQWAATYPDKRRRFLCSVHRQALDDLKENGVKYIFVGAMPHGTDNP